MDCTSFLKLNNSLFLKTTALCKALKQFFVKRIFESAQNHPLKSMQILLQENSFLQCYCGFKKNKSESEPKYFAVFASKKYILNCARFKINGVQCTMYIVQ